MAFKSTRKKTGTNSYETVTHNQKTGGIRRTRTVKLPGITRSTSISTKKPGTRITTSRKVADGYTQRTSYSTVKKPKGYKTKTRRNSSGTGLSFKKISFILIAIVVIAIFA
jgi:hypothetical protein